jgi:hypothetical protein
VPRHPLTLLDELVVGRHRSLRASLVACHPVDDLVDELVVGVGVHLLLAPEDLPSVLHGLRHELQLVVELVVASLVGAEGLEAVVTILGLVLDLGAVAAFEEACLDGGLRHRESDPNDESLRRPKTEPKWLQVCMYVIISYVYIHIYHIYIYIYIYIYI